MASIYDMTFRRRFSINPYKTLKMPLGEMSCYKNWVDDRRGDPYPIISTNCDEENKLSESLPGARWCIENKTAGTLETARLLGLHFPYASYEMTLDELNVQKGGMGFRFEMPTDHGPLTLVIAVCGGERLKVLREFMDESGMTEEIIETDEAFEAGMSFIVTTRGMSFDVYFQKGIVPCLIGTFTLPQMKNIISYDVFMRTTAAALVRLAPGEAAQCGVRFYLDGGVSHADMKCMRYENGMPIMKDGRLFMTMSSRNAAGGFQSVVSWNPSTADLKLEGALFFDAGDGLWCSDVATSAVYDRRSGEWYVWACSFSHGHILCHGRSQADLRYGINVIDVDLMPIERTEGGEADSLAAEAGGSLDRKAAVSDDTLFFAKCGDEDPDLLYDAARGKWLLTICRLITEKERSCYRYFLFESDDPFEGFKYVDRTRVGTNTGGSMIRVDGRLYLLCGSDFDKRAQYHLHPIEDLSRCDLLKCDFDDGGFRGWGTLIPVPCGRRTRYLWMTFDRHNGSDYNWSYGNIYVFEADHMNIGYEWPLRGLE